MSNRNEWQTIIDQPFSFYLNDTVVEQREIMGLIHLLTEDGMELVFDNADTVQIIKSLPSDATMKCTYIDTYTVFREEETVAFTCTLKIKGISEHNGITSVSCKFSPLTEEIEHYIERKQLCKYLHTIYKEP